MPSVKINGKSLFYTIDGDSTTKVTTLFIHGIGSSSCFYHSIIPGLKSSTRCIALDTPGSGLSELGKSEQSIATIGEDVVGLLDTLNIKEKIIVVGHSVGCAVANFLAATYPDRVRAVVLLGPVNPDFAIASVFEQRIEVIKSEGLERLAKSIPLTATGERAGSLQHAFIRTLILSTSPEGYMSLCHVMATAQQPNYGAINVPLLIITGSDDVTAPLSGPKDILEKYGTKKTEKSIKDLSGIGHWHCVEAPDDVEGLIKEFIQTIK
ncbi:hypothetical protein V500_00625 [Pseudogymnoascus sp. VKM F-4518 (FW-2643)]|nr:hypothetical protein V500_00625 [Pseudogymnoascus sp. VKM F-4518 (FW-2643)]